MANRNFVFDALVVRRWPIGEAHRGVAFITRERGPLNAIAHGAARSTGRLKTLTTPIRRVQLKAYHDPVADSWKVVDLDALSWYGGLAELWARAMTASLWTEILTRTQVVGEPSELYEATVTALSILDSAPEPGIDRLNATWLWSGLETTGMVPDFTACTVCERPLSGLDVAYWPQEGDWACPECSRGRGQRLSASAVDALLMDREVPWELLAQSAGVADAELVAFALRLWEQMIGGELRAASLWKEGRA